jgi:hypothetical protein
VTSYGTSITGSKVKGIRVHIFGTPKKSLLLTPLQCNITHHIIKVYSTHIAYMFCSCDQSLQVFLRYQNNICNIHARIKETP